MAISGEGYTPTVATYMSNRAAVNPREGVSVVFKRSLAFTATETFSSAGAAMLAEASKASNDGSIMSIVYEVDENETSADPVVWQDHYDQFEFLRLSLPESLRGRLFWHRAQRRPTPNTADAEFDRWGLNEFSDSFGGTDVNNPSQPTDKVSATHNRFMAKFRQLAQFKQADLSRETMISLRGATYSPFDDASFFGSEDQYRYVHNPMLYSSMQFCQDMGVEHIIIGIASVDIDLYGTGDNPTTWFHDQNQQGLDWVANAIYSFFRNITPDPSSPQYGIKI